MQCYEQSNQQKLNPNTSSLFGKYDSMKDLKELAKIIVLACLSFRFASSPYFITYIQRIYNSLFKDVPRIT